MNSRWMSVRRVTLLAGLALVAGSAGIASGEPPTGWFAAGSDPKGYEFRSDTSAKHGGKASGSIRAKNPAADKFGTMMQMFRADAYRGKRMRMTAYVKSKDVDGWTGLWMRVDGKDKTALAFDNMGDRPIKGTSDWKKYEVVLDVPDAAAAIAFGVLLHGKGQVWVDDFKFEAVGKEVETTGKDIRPRQMEREVRKDLPQKPKNLDFEQ